MHIGLKNLISAGPLIGLNMKHVVVTGATGGMGRSTCRLLLSKGYSVLALGTSRAKLSLLKETCNSEFLYTLALSFQEPDYFKVFQNYLDALGWDKLYGLIHLAAVSKGNRLSLISEEDWQESFQINVHAPMKITQLCLPLMQANEQGSIIFVSSPVALVGARKISYASTKSALHGLMISIAKEQGINNIRANLLLPGPTITDMTKDWSIEKRTNIAQQPFLKRLCEPDEVAKVLEFVLSEQASFMTGSVVDLTAGSMIGH